MILVCASPVPVDHLVPTSLSECEATAIAISQWRRALRLPCASRMVRKRKSLAEELANLADPTPTDDFDPEDLDFRTDNPGDEGVVRDDSDDGDEVRPIEVGRSALRMANAMSDPSLKQGAYAGTVRKRQRTAQTKFGDDV